MTRWTSKARALLWPNGREGALYRYFSARRPAPVSGASAVVLVQSVEDPYYFGLFGLIVSALRNLRPIRPEQFVLNSPRVGESHSARRLLKSRFINWLSLTKWIRLYRAYCDRVGDRKSVV